jgi:hypothetical protein
MGKRISEVFSKKQIAAKEISRPCEHFHPKPNNKKYPLLFLDKIVCEINFAILLNRYSFRFIRVL